MKNEEVEKNNTIVDKTNNNINSIGVSVKNDEISNADQKENDYFKSDSVSNDTYIDARKYQQEYNAKEDDKEESENQRKQLNKSVCSSKSNNLKTSDLTLTKQSKRLVILRVIILILIFIFIPFESILSERMDHFELKLIFKHVNKIVTDKVLKSKLYIDAIKFLQYLLLNLDSLCIYCSLLYYLFHPFRALKIVVMLSLGSYFITLLRMIYSAPRPFWYEVVEIPSCLVSYASPSISIFATMFFISLFMIQYIEAKKKENIVISTKMKVLGYVFIFFLFFIIVFLHIITKLNFIYQQFFALNLCFIMITIILDIDVSIHNYLLECFKNPYKTRKYKIHIFIISLCLSVVGGLIYAVNNSSHTQIEYIKIVVQINNCNNEVYLFGTKAAFLNTSYIFNIPGVFWGAGFTVEKGLGKWWASSPGKNFAKSCVLIIFSFCYMLAFDYLTDVIKNFELIYVISCVKYFLFFHVTFGYFPVIFDFLNLNEKPEFLRETDDNENEEEIEEKNEKKFLRSRTSFAYLDEEDLNFYRGSASYYDKDSTLKTGKLVNKNKNTAKPGILDNMEAKKENFINYINKDEIEEVDEDKSVSSNENSNRTNRKITNKAASMIRNEKIGSDDDNIHIIAKDMNKKKKFGTVIFGKSKYSVDQRLDSPEVISNKLNSNSRIEPKKNSGNKEELITNYNDKDNDESN